MKQWDIKRIAWLGWMGCLSYSDAYWPLKDSEYTNLKTEYNNFREWFWDNEDKIKEMINKSKH
jgi:hypothetical protein